MSLDPKSIGQPLKSCTREYSWKDCILYALGVGSGFDELSFIYEKEQQVLPTFGLTHVFGFLDEVARITNMNQDGVVHGEQDLVFHKAIPPNGSFRTEGCIKDIYDKGKGALVLVESDTWDEQGDKLFTSTISLFARFDGGFGGKASPSSPAFSLPKREPDHTIHDQPSPSQPALYRLCGDFFPIHIDPEFATSVGFVSPIMHGLCTYGYACRAALKSLCNNQPAQLKRLAVRFSNILYPGQPIATKIWDLGNGIAQFQVVNLDTNAIVLDRGLIEYG